MSLACPNRGSRIRILLAFLAAFGSLAPRAAELTTTKSMADDWLLRTWQTKDGLPQNTVNATVQTRDGFLWVGTSGGLARFDGARFRSFGLQDGLRSVYVSCLWEDRSGTLWVGTTGGGISRWENGRFSSPPEPDVLAGTHVQAMAGERDGVLWIGTERGLFKRQRETITKVGPEDGLPPGQIRALLVDSRGVLWVSVLLKGLFQRSSDAFVMVSEGKGGLESTYSLMEDRDGAVWAGCEASLWQIHQGLWTRYTRTNGVPGSSIFSLAQGSQGPLWVGTRGAGLHVFVDGRFHPFKRETDPSEGRTWGLLVDRQGAVWFGIPGEGLKRLTRRVLQNWGVAEGLPKPSVVSVAEDATGRLWAATFNGGISRREEGRFTSFKDPGSSYPNPYSLLATADGCVWAAGEQFLIRFIPGAPARLFDAPPIRGEAIRAMCADGQALWLGTYYSSLLRVEGTNVQVAATNGSFGGNIACLVRESAGTIWIGSASGLYRWEKGKVQGWTTRDGLLSASIASIHRDEDGTLWLGTLGGGLSRFKNGRFVNITTRQGLVDDVVQQIVADDFGQLWLGSNRGLMCLARGELDELADGKTAYVHAAVFGQNEGMLSEQCTGGHSPTALKTRNGLLLFPTVRGIVEIDPRKCRAQTAAIPQATIEDVIMDGQPQNGSSSLVMPPGRQRLEVHYTAPCLQGGDWVRFRFRMQPLEADWVSAGARRTAFYPQLPPGNYVFRVQAGDSQGNWNEIETSLAVTVKPEFWQTWWFACSIAALLGVAIFSVFKRRMATLERRQMEQEAVTRQIILSQENERKRVAGELHDGLNQNLALLAIEMEMFSQQLPESTGAPNARLQALSAQTKSLSAEVHRISHGLHPAKLTQLGLAIAVRGFCREVEAAHKIPVNFTAHEIPRVLPEEVALCLYRVTQEAIQNVIKHSGAKNATVELTTIGNAIELIITDDGKGFDVNENRASGSLGLVSMAERVRLVNGQITVESKPGTGTRVYVRVPLPQGTTK